VMAPGLPPPITTAAVRIAVPASVVIYALCSAVLLAVSRRRLARAIVAEDYAGESPIQPRGDPAAALVPDRYTPFMGRASRQRPVRRAAAVKVPLRLPRPMPD